MTKKRDSLRVRKPRQTTVENRTIIISKTTSSKTKPEIMYVKNQKKAHELRERRLYQCGRKHEEWFEKPKGVHT